MSAHPLDPFGRAPARAGLFLDFDGVLADIAPEPDAARARPGVADLLVDLCEHLGRVAVISGRPVDYLDAMIPSPVDVVGLYGLESRIDGVRATLAEAEVFRPIVGELVERATGEFGATVVEPKGLSLTIHYRRHPEMASLMGEWASAEAARTGMERRAAKHSFELHPALDRDKGTALLELAVGLDPVGYLGDDLGDLPAFDGLDELASNGVAAVRIAVDSSETPPELCRRADVVVEGPAGAEALLRELLGAVGQAGAAAT